MASSGAMQQLGSPDDNASGLIEGALDPLRYGGQTLDPDEVSGIVTSMIPVGATVLDVGCGTGSLGKIVADACGAKVLGVEPDASRAECAKSRGLQVYAGYLLPELMSELGLFDVVLLADVLEHVPNPHALLQLCRKFVGPRGALIISVPNVAHWSVRANLLRGKFEYGTHGIMDATHLRWFTAASIRSLLASSGLMVTEYRASVCAELIDNAYRRPLSWLSPKQRLFFLRFACRRWPTLFGAQHVLKAETA